MRSSDTYECDRCEFRQHVNPSEFKEKNPKFEGLNFCPTEEILVDWYGWTVQEREPEGPMKKNVNIHICPDCSKK